MNTFRGGPFPTCRFHERPLMRCAVADVPDPDRASSYELSCPDCVGDLLAGRRLRLLTPSIPISRAEFDALPANPRPFGLGPDGGRILV